MAHLFQVGAGSGGMPVLDLLCRDQRITRRHPGRAGRLQAAQRRAALFPLSAVGQPKAELARHWLRERRPDLEVRTLVCDLCDPAQQAAFDEIAADGRHRRLRRRQRAGQVSLGCADAAARPSPGRWAKCSAAASAASSTGCARRALLRLRRQPLAALRGGGQGTGARLLAAGRAGARDDHPGQQGVHPRDRVAARPGHACIAGPTRPAAFDPGFTSCC